METGYEYIQKLTDDQLVKMVTETYDEEEIPFVLSEIVKRKHPKTAQLCLEKIYGYMIWEKSSPSQGRTKSTLWNLYNYDKSQAISFFKEQYKKLPIDAFGGFIISFYNEEKTFDIELVKLIKNHLKTLKKEEIQEIQNDYDEFMKAYKNV